MSADPFSSGFSAPHEGRLVTTSEAVLLLGIDEGALWRLLEDGGIRVHTLHEDGQQFVAISVRDLLDLRGHVLSQQPGRETFGQEDPRTFELELMHAQQTNLRERGEHLEQRLRERQVELERTQRDLEEERGQRLQREILKSHLARVGEQLETTGARLTDLEQELSAAIEDRDRQLAELNQARDEERSALCMDRARLTEDLQRSTRELETLRQAVLVGNAEREGLRRELQQACDLERATQRYCDRLEARGHAG